MTIDARLQTILKQLKLAKARYPGSADDISLLAVSKQRSIEEIQQAIACGQHAFGENYCQEALPKIAALKAYSLEWHFIGNIQTNKTHEIAEHFDWVQSVSRLKIAQRLNEQRPDDLPPLNICIQINIDEEDNKSGVFLDELQQLAADIDKLPRLKLRGLMAIPQQRDSFEEQCKPFRKMKQAFEALNEQGVTLDCLSMGMTNDYQAAIAQGASMIRIGTAIFGPRR